jgi:hypothetical protein
MQFKTIANQEFVELKAEIESYPRLCGHYLVDLIAIPGLPEGGVDREMFLKELFQYFDDHEWPPPSGRATDQSWDDYQCDRDVATAHVVEALVGGRSIGHTDETMSHAKALEFWYRFEALLEEPRHYYTGMGLGDQEQVFLYGAVIVGSDAAGLLWIAESD